jgi:hypothetical protein
MPAFKRTFAFILSMCITNILWFACLSSLRSKTKHRTFIEALNARFVPNKTGILSYFDLSYVEMAVNFYETSLKAHGISQFVFAVSGEDCCTKLTEYGVPADACFVYRTDNASSRASSYGSQDFNRKTNIRTDMILDALQAGFTVIHSDVDMIFKNNPLPALKAYSTCDVATMNDHSTHNSGFVHVRPTNRSMTLYRKLRNIGQNNTELNIIRLIKMPLSDWLKGRQ